MRTASRIGSGLAGWGRLTVVAALANAVVLFGYGLTRGDREALVGSVVMLAGVGLLRIGSGLLGLLVLAALFVNIELWMFRAAGRGAAAPTGVLAVVFVFTSLGLVWAMTDAAPQAAPAGALEVETVNVAYVPDSLRASSGEVRVAVRNRDLFWHTFTIDALGVDVTAPVGRLRSASFEARPGTYSYYCRIPGHATLGMRGTITVR